MIDYGQTFEGDLDNNFNYDPSEVFPTLSELRDFEQEPKPFLVVLTSGLESLDLIKSELGKAGIGIESEHNIDNFETFARNIYPLDLSKPHSHLWLMMNRKLYGANPSGKVLLLSAHLMSNYDYITEVKRQIRKVIGVREYEVKHNDQAAKVTFHHLHAPDLDELKYQYNCLLNFCNSLIEA